MLSHGLYGLQLTQAVHACTKVHHLAAKGSRFPCRKKCRCLSPACSESKEKQTVATTGCCTYRNNFACPGCTCCSKDSFDKHMRKK